MRLFKDTQDPVSAWFLEVCAQEQNARPVPWASALAATGTGPP
jgi:hypothetical protein